MSDNPVVHFEMPYKDGDRVAKFYEQAFGWKMNQTGPEMSDYITAETTKTEQMRAVTPGAINGGFYPIASSDNPTPSVVISVKDINTAMQKVKDAGGTVQGEPIDIPRVGKYVPFTDSEGNRASMLQP